MSIKIPLSTNEKSKKVPIFPKERIGTFFYGLFSCVVHVTDIDFPREETTDESKGCTDLPHRKSLDSDTGQHAQNGFAEE